MGMGMDMDMEAVRSIAATSTHKRRILQVPRVGKSLVTPKRESRAKDAFSKVGTATSTLTKLLPLMRGRGRAQKVKVRNKAQANHAVTTISMAKEKCMESHRKVCPARDVEIRADSVISTKPRKEEGVIPCKPICHEISMKWMNDSNNIIYNICIYFISQSIDHLLLLWDQSVSKSSYLMECRFLVTKTSPKACYDCNGISRKSLKFVDFRDIAVWRIGNYKPGILLLDPKAHIIYTNVFMIDIDQSPSCCYLDQRSNF